MSRLFGTDGMRGIAGEHPLTLDFVERLGLAAGNVLARRVAGRPRSVFIVRDTRRSGPELQAALTRGLTSAGFDVKDGGVLPTPSVAVLVPRRRFAAGAVISASHNPAEFNGIKFFGPEGTKLEDDWEVEIESLLTSAEPLPAASRRGKASVLSNAKKEYLDFLRSTWPSDVSLDNFTLAIDCANGSTSPIAVELFRSLGAKVVVQSNKPNGLNINKNCGALHPESLAKAVLKSKARLGAAFDGDGDRAIFVDEEGVVRDGDHVLLAGARHLKSQGRLEENLVVVTVMANLGLRRALAALGVDTLETSVGDKYVWQGLKKTGAVLGGEQSGHIIFREFLPTGDGLLTALQVLAVLQQSRRSLSALSSLVVGYPQVLLNVRVKEKKPLEQIDGFSNEMKRVKDLLGDTGRLLVRYSGTEPLLRIMLEGPSTEQIQGYADELALCVRRAGL